MYEELRTDFSRTLKRAMRFYRVDLHVHSMLSHDFAAQDADEQDKGATAEAAVRQALKQGLYVMAVTDHNHCRATAAVREAAEKIRAAGANEYENNSLLLLPAIEVTIKDDGEVFHVLCLFPEDKAELEIERILGDTGLETKPAERTATSQITKVKAQEFCDRVRGLGGITIAAHINDPKGFRDAFRDALKPAELDLRIHSLFNAVEIKKPAERRHFEDIEVAGKKVSLACLIDSDAHHIRDIGAKPAITRVKMGRPSFKDLKRALSDPKTRIRFEDDVKGRYPILRGIRIEGGFLDGFKRGFSENLNCLIGGRGVGKSSIIEMLRYALNVPVPGIRSEEVKSMLGRVLGDGKITAIFDDPAGATYVLERTRADAGPKVFTADGTPIVQPGGAIPGSVRVEVYGWSEIEKIAKDPFEQLDLIDGFVSGIGILKGEEARVLSELARGRESLVSVGRQAAEKGIGLDALEGLRTELGLLAKKGIDDAEAKDAKVLAEEGLLDEIEAALNQFELSVEGVSDTAQVSTAVRRIGESVAADALLNKEVFERLKTDLAAAIGEEGSLTQALVKLKKETADMKLLLVGHRATLAASHVAVRKEFQTALEGTQESDVKKAIEKRAQLRKKIAELEAQKQEYDKLCQKRVDEQGARDVLLQRLEDVRAKLFSQRSAEIGKIRDGLNFQKAGVSICVELEQGGNRQAFEARLAETLKGINLNWKSRETPAGLASHIDPLAFVKAVRASNAEALAFENKDNPKLGVTAEDAQKLVAHYQQTEEILLKIQELPCPDRPRILLSDGTVQRPVEELSPGQRCTALLPIIFLQSNFPLVIDQPEDNLDNKLVFDLVVDTLRTLKERRQVIVATHNPNVPVSGDAELIMVFQSNGKQGEVIDDGSIDDSNIIQHVKKIMEGGEEAFLVRSKKYTEGLQDA